MNTNQGFSCALGCLMVALLAGVLAAFMLMVIGGWTFLQGAFAGIFVFVIAGALLSWVLCRPLPALGEATIEKPHVGTATGASAAAAASAGGSDVPADTAAEVSDGASAAGDAAASVAAASGAGGSDATAETAAEASDAASAKSGAAAAASAGGSDATADTATEASDGASAKSDAAASQAAASDDASAKDASAGAESASSGTQSGGASIKPSTPLPGQEELAARKGSWTYDGTQNAAEKVAPAAEAVTADTTSTPDYDGDGKLEGSDEGTRPEALSGPRGGKADNLKEIKGIGPKLEKLCNSLGFYHFDQIANWTPDEVAWVNANLEGFKGRVTRDTWVEQAKILAAGGDTEFSKKVDKGGVYD